MELKTVIAETRTRAGETGTLASPAVKQLLQELRQTDNRTNWFYLGRAWLYLALVAGLAIAFFRWNTYGWWWNLPVGVLAVFLMGAGMHQLTALTHEASHFTLFKNRWLNEWVSELCCMYPLYSSTHLYRLQHMAHHQFVNDPDRDPDLAQVKSSGHWIGNPAPQGAFQRMLVRQLWLPNLLRFMVTRARFNAVGTRQNPYFRKGFEISKVPGRVGIGYLLGMILVLSVAVVWRIPWLLWAGPLVLTVLMAARVLAIRPEQFVVTRITPVIPARWQMMLRLGINGAIYTGLAYMSLYVDPLAPVYYAVLWLGAIFTSFGLFMMLRQVVQHGNADRGWITNTRVFLVGDFIRFAVFPLGQDYHLPHHLYSSIPHYNLPRLHRELMRVPEYAAEAVEVHGYFRRPRGADGHPTVLEVLGPGWSRQGHEAFFDHTVLDRLEVAEREQIEAEEELSQGARGAEV